MSNAFNSNIGFPSLYESGDQRTHAHGEASEFRRRTGENVEGFLPKGQAGELNRLHTEEIQRKQAENLKKDPTLAATMHGNAPSKGAIIDKELQQEDEAVLSKKKDAMTGKKF
ncbi:uncharacterized protein P884DRAFT_292222 [Thermothelomyces heterothallicus CBS 202.75]|uniref:uncharacterized protein n=1 Tax=Thermothelomyces heterothallicus CBS 202.75 TaxID=1149848 RepID=UPI0037420B38